MNNRKTTLHIPQLNIEGFRGIRKLHLSKLGRVTLLAGKNNIGKTTILEAIRLFSSRGDEQSCQNLLDCREELAQDGDELLYPDYSALFHEYLPNEYHSKSPTISIDAGREGDKISLKLVDAEDDHLEGSFLDLNAQIKTLEIKCGKLKRSSIVGELKKGKN